MSAHGTLYYKIYEDLKIEIKTGKRNKGDKLPSEDELSNIYKVSRITVRKALDMLSKEKLVTRKTGVGTFVIDEPISSQKNDTKTLCQMAIGLIVEWVDEAFGLTYLYEIDKYANSLGYKIIYAFTYGNQEKEKSEINFMISQNVVGMIIMPCHGQYYNPEILKMILEGFPVLFFDRNLNGLPVNYVTTDNKQSAVTLVNHAFSKGHKHIALVTSDTSTISVNDRVTGYIDACEHSIYPDNKNNIFTIFSNTKPTFNSRNITKDYDCICNIIDYNPLVTCFIFTEHELAVAFEAVYKQHAKCNQLPVELYTFDCNINYFGGCEYTHIHQDEKELAIQSVNKLLHLITIDKTKPNSNCFIPGTLIENTFVGPLNNNEDDI